MPHVQHHTTTPRQTPKQSQPTKQQNPILSYASSVLMDPTTTSTNPQTPTSPPQPRAGHATHWNTQLDHREFHVVVTSKPTYHQPPILSYVFCAVKTPKTPSKSTYIQPKKSSKNLGETRNAPHVPKMGENQGAQTPFSGRSRRKSRRRRRRQKELFNI